MPELRRAPSGERYDMDALRLHAPMSLANEQANGRMHPGAPQSTTATIVVYAAQNQAAPTAHKARQRKRSGQSETSPVPPRRRISLSPWQYLTRQTTMRS